MENPLRLVGAFLVLISLPVPVVLAIDGSPVWFNSTVATPVSQTTISSPSLAFDHLGMPSLSWSQLSSVGGSNTVTRSERSGLGLWSHRLVASGQGVGVATSLSFDRSERPIVGWMNETMEVFADFNNGQTVNMAGGNADADVGALSLSHDLAGNLRGLYAGSAVGSMHSISFNGATFSSAPMTTLAGVNDLMDAQLTTDHAGRRHVVARADLAAGGEGVVIASEPSFPTNWPSATLTTADQVLGVAAATNPLTGHVALAYTTRDNGSNTSKLVFAEFNGIALETTEVLSSTTSAFQDISLAYDLTDGRPAIAFEESVGGNDRLSLAYLNGSSQWLTSLIDDSVSFDSFNSGLKPSLAFDDYGTSYPAVAYVDADGSLTVAFDPPATPEPATALLVMVAAASIRRRRLP
jgi:MYXO-CTERM domain-containing protein